MEENFSFLLSLVAALFFIPQIDVTLASRKQYTWLKLSVTTFILVLSGLLIQVNG